MNLNIDIEKDIFKQFAEQLGILEETNCIILKPSQGSGKIERINYPNSLEFYHFSFQLKKELTLSSVNPTDSDFFLLNINLSEESVEKNVNGSPISFQKYLPSGILYYPPNINVSSRSPINISFDIALIKFHKSLLKTYFPNDLESFLKIKDSIIYEDLDHYSEKVLRKVLNKSSKIDSHVNLLSFLSNFFNKLQKRSSKLNYENLHPEDVKHLFIAAALLRNPKPDVVPSIEELSQISKMSKTKFKNIFRQVFGSPPLQYHQQIKMEYAKDELEKKTKNSSEIAFELGYSHPSKFTRAFKKYFGNPPSKI